MSLVHPNSLLSPRRWVRMLWGMQGEYERRVVECRNVLAIMQRSDHTDTRLVEAFEDLLGAYNLDYDDVDTSAAEVDRLAQAIEMNDLKETLGVLRDPNRRDSSTLLQLRNRLVDLKLASEDIGTTDEELNAITREIVVATAHKNLQILRDLENRDSFAALWLQSQLAENDLSLHDIGTTEKELQELIARTNVNRARMYYTELIEGDDVIIKRHFFKILREMVGREEVQLSEIGTSEEELNELEALMRQSDIEVAKTLLSQIRDAEGDSEFNFADSVMELRRIVALHEITADELDATQEELNAYSHRYFVTHAQSHLKNVRDTERVPKNRRLSSFDYILDLTREEIVTAEEIGTTPQELLQYAKDMEIDPEQTYE